MKYSVVIPLYNKEKYICNTIQSVLAQTLRDFEIIVIDDGSSDSSLNIVQKIAEKTNKIHVIVQENQGVAVARNKGVEYAKGDYIAFLDADDEWRTDYLETIDKLTEKYTESDIYVTAYCVVMNDEKCNYSTQLSPEDGCLESYWLTFRYTYDFVWTSATVIRRNAILNAGGFKPGEKVGQDLDMWARVAQNNPKVAYSSKVCVNYNRGADNNARSRAKIAFAEAFMHDLEQEMQNENHTEEEIAMIQHKYDLKMIVYVFTCILAGEKNRAKKVLQSWKSQRTFKKRILKICLWIAMFVPHKVNQTIYAIRLKVF